MLRYSMFHWTNCPILNKSQYSNAVLLMWFLLHPGFLVARDLLGVRVHLSPCFGVSSGVSLSSCYDATQTCASSITSANLHCSMGSGQHVPPPPPSLPPCGSHLPQTITAPLHPPHPHPSLLLPHSTPCNPLHRLIWSGGCPGTYQHAGDHCSLSACGPIALISGGCFTTLIKQH